MEFLAAIPKRQDDAVGLPVKISFSFWGIATGQKSYVVPPHGIEP